MRTKQRPDPRQVGDVCWCGYWRDWYTVLDIQDIGFTVITVAWSDGRVRTHRTPWDWRRGGDALLVRP